METIALVPLLASYPEQYNAVDCDGNVLAHISCDDGALSVVAPGGATIYSSPIGGGGYLDAEERAPQLRAAKWAIINHYLGVS